MRFFDLPNSLLLAVCISSVTATTHNTHRVLRAATKRTDILKRDARISQKFESEVVYIEDGNVRTSRETFASSVRVGSKKPILSLEDIEHLLQDVACEDGRMTLHFVDAASARDARAACHGGHGGMGGLIITSHPSCNDDGERAVYKIDDATLAHQGVALDLAVTKSLWQDAFDNIDITFGHTRYDHIVRRHADSPRSRRKRQPLEIPADTPDNVTDVVFDLASELLDTTFSAADFLSGLDSIADMPGAPDLPLEIGCTNCSTRGTIALTQGAIKLDTSAIDVVPDIFEGGKDDGKELTSVITGGYVDLAVSGVGARLDMFARPVSSGAYQIALFPLPVLGFVIPGIGQAGASFEPRISAEFEVEGEVGVRYGIDVGIPDGAGIKVELGDLANTTITGIKGATLDALPFTSNVSDADIALSLAFTPVIPIGFEFSDKLSAMVTVSLDLPRLSAKLTTNAKDQCSLLDKGNQTKPVKNPSKDASLSNLVLVEANISVSIGVAADLTLPLLPPPFDTAGTSANLFSTAIPLMTSCVAAAKDGIKVTQMAPVATLSADKADIVAPTASACTKHETVKPCACATATTTVYAAPPPPSDEYTGAPPEQIPPPLDMTPYYPDEQPPATPPSSSSCAKSTTLRVTISAPTAPPTAPSHPVILIPGSKACTANSTLVPSAPSTHPPSTTTSASTTAPASTKHSETDTNTETETETKTQNSHPQSSTTTPSPPPIEESKGFLAPPPSTSTTSQTLHSGTAPPTRTAPAEFTGGAAPGVRVGGVRWCVGAGAGAGVLGLWLIGGAAAVL